MRYERGRNISIHALRGEGDRSRNTLFCPARYFNPRPPWGGRLQHRLDRRRRLEISIHALRGEGDQRADRERVHYRRHFNPRPPWGGRQTSGSLFERYVAISIHALRGEGDGVKNSASIRFLAFQSTPSVGRATMSDVIMQYNHEDFNPRPPWGGRLQKYTNMQCYACT